MENTLSEVLREILTRQPFPQPREVTVLLRQHGFAAGSPAEDACLEELVPLLAHIAQKCPRRLAIDGRSASGKTTAAALLERLCGFSLVHMDDFYLPEALRTPERLREPGGNVHYERFEKEVLGPLRRGEVFDYGIYDCREGRLSGRRQVDGRGPVLIEGAYCLRPAFGEPYDCTAFYDIAPALQRERLLQRNGPEAAARFESLWIPLENRYHEICRTRQRVQLVLQARADR